MQYVSPHKRGGGLAGGADEAGYEGFAAALRCVGESGGGDEEIGVEDEGMGFGGDGDGGGEGAKGVNGVTWTDEGGCPIVRRWTVWCSEGGGDFCEEGLERGREWALWLKRAEGTF